MRQYIESLVFKPPFSQPGLGLDYKIYNEYPSRPVLLYSHGNAGTINGSDYPIELCRKYRLNVCLFDYSGYGYSRAVPEGVPWVQQILRDGEEMVTVLTNKYGYKIEDIVFWGRSLGTGVASHLAWRYPACRGVLLVSPYISLSAVASWSWTSVLGPVLALTLGAELNSEYKLQVFSGTAGECKIFILHGTNDTMIPVYHSRHLESKLNCLIHYCDSGHNDIEPEDYHPLMFHLSVDAS